MGLPPIFSLALVGSVLGYLVTAAMLWGRQTRLIFKPRRTLHAKPADFPFTVLDVAVPVKSAGRADQTLRAWWIPSAKPNAKVIVYLHGNDVNVSTSIREVEPLRELGYSVFMIDYRGYGASDGAFPSEASVYQDAQAAWAYLVMTGIDPSDLYIYGHSLGGAVAIDLAARHHEAGGLIVESSFTSIYDMAMLSKPIALLPVKLFLKHRFESLGKVASLRLPALYIHGTADEIVPFDMGRRLFDATTGFKRFSAIEGGRHDDNAIAGGSAFRSAISAFVEDTSALRAASSAEGAAARGSGS
jgi:pimeloyl-ACP methyl ester carboxylesterase